MHRFFVSKEQIIDDHIFIEGKDFSHIKNVLRLREGERIELSCHGINYISEIVDISNKTIRAKILSQEEGKSEPKIEITLFQGLPKGSKMDLVIQKCVELGVKDFYAVETARSVAKIKDGKKESSKLERWQAIAEEAAKQSKRDYIPQIKGILKFNEMVDILSDKKNIIVPYESEENLSIKDGLKAVEGNDINLIIGPEGGFEEEEIEALKAIGSVVVSLGPRILRTETAGLVASTIILYQLGELGVI